MPEFMLYVRNIDDHDSTWTPAQEQEFLKKCEVYIEKLKSDGKLISAQPLSRQGAIISGQPGHWQKQSINPGDEIQVGYYYIRAKDLDEAVKIAKGNPEFEYTSTAKVEVRPIKAEEKTTGYIYPTN